MNIFQIIASNLRSGPVTLPFPERVTPAGGFRGLVLLEPELCTGCATCVYVCMPAALQVSALKKSALKKSDNKEHYEWRYDPGQCTFCGRCIEVCPTHALEMAADRPPVYRQARELLVSYRLTYPICPECGRPAYPVNQAVLERAFEEITGEILTWSRLCERCRARRYHPALLSLSHQERMP